MVMYLIVWMQIIYFLMYDLCNITYYLGKQFCNKPIGKAFHLFIYLMSYFIFNYFYSSKN